jgi:hypothetical protein
VIGEKTFVLPRSSVELPIDSNDGKNKKNERFIFTNFTLMLFLGVKFDSQVAFATKDDNVLHVNDERVKAAADKLAPIIHRIMVVFHLFAVVFECE